MTKRILILLAMLAAGCGAQTTDAPQDDVAVTAQPLTAQQAMAAMNLVCAPLNCQVSDLTREATGIPGQAHYNWKLRVGTAPDYYYIGMDRVTDELAEFVPKPSQKPVFLAHGDTLNFRVSYLIGHDGTMATSSSAFLASHGVDVWGITQRDRMIPASVTDTSFMQNWDMNTYASDTRKAMYFARAMRVLSLGFGKFDFLGWSRGAQLSYIIAQQESQIPDTGWNRSVQTIIPVDAPLKSDDEAFISTICNVVIPAIQTTRANGTYAESSALIVFAGSLALSDPDGLTPILPMSGLTNRQLAMMFGGATWNFQPYVPWYHLSGSILTENNPMGFPLQFRYTDEEVLFSVMAGAPAYEANGVMLQGDQVICDDSTNLDDHLDDVTIPTFYIGANGGFGAGGFYTTSLLGTDPDDIQLLNIEITGDQFDDFGHDDVFRAPEAEELVFEPVLAWIEEHD